jgi:hypothetical protein
MTVALSLCIGAALGVWLGINLAVGTGFIDRLADRVGTKILHDHRIYRILLADKVGSLAEADRMVVAYRETESL